MSRRLFGKLAWPQAGAQLLEVPEMTENRIFTINAKLSNFIRVYTNICDHKINLFVDTGSDINLLKENILPKNYKSYRNFNPQDNCRISGITKGFVHTIGSVILTLIVRDKQFSGKFFIVDKNFPINTEGILGREFLEFHKTSIDFSTRQVIFGHGFGIDLIDTVTCNYMNIPPFCEIERTLEPCCLDLNGNSDQVIIGGELQPGVYLGKGVVSRNNVVVRILNATHECVNVLVSSLSNRFESVDNFEIKTVKLDPERNDKLKKFLKERIPKYAREDVLSLCDRYADVFLLDGELISCCNFFEANLVPKDAEIVYTPQYRLPHAHRDEIIRVNRELIEQDIIEESFSPHNSPLILVPKKGSSKTKWRMVVDFRKLNKKLIPAKFPLPRIDDIFDNLGNSTVYSVLDLSSGFYQIPLKKECRQYTSFTTPLGQFQYKRLPQGCSASPGQFSRAMQIAFSKMIPKKAWVYMDDLICLGKSQKDHLSNLEEIFKVCRERNLKLNPEKCQFFKPEVLYLGHILSSEGIKPNPEKYEVIENYPRPVNGGEAKRFVAICNFYRKFIRNFSTLTKPLTNLSRKRVVFDWTPECEQAFQTLKKTLVRGPILHYPNFKKTFIVTCDASDVGCGGLLSQLNDKGEEVPICFASKNFTQGERNKPAIEKELIALHWAILHFKPYLYGTRFLCKSDHRPLSFIWNLRNPTGRLARIRLELAEFEFDVTYIKGSTNVVADALSRISFEKIKENSKVEQVQVAICVKAITRSKTRAEKPQNKEKHPEAVRDNQFSLIEADTNLKYLNLPEIKIKLKIDPEERATPELLASIEAKKTRDLCKRSLKELDNKNRKENGIPVISAIEISVSIFPKRAIAEKLNKPSKFLKTDPRNTSKAPKNQNLTNQNNACTLVENKNKNRITEDVLLEALEKLLIKLDGKIAQVATKENSILWVGDKHHGEKHHSAKPMFRMSPRNSIFRRLQIGNFKKVVNKHLVNGAIVLCKTPALINDNDQIRNLIETYHNNPLLGGHYGPAKMLSKLKLDYIWKNMRKEVFEYTRKCVKCQLNKAHAKTKQPMTITDTPQKAYDVLELDTVGPLIPCQGFRYILTMQCVLTKFVVGAPMRTKSAEEIALTLFNNFIYLHGFPKCLKTDNGTEFNNRILAELTRICEVNHRFATAYRPQTMGAVERNHRVINDYFRNYSDLFAQDWTRLIKLYSFAWNTSPNSQISNFTPYELVYGKRCNLPSIIEQPIKPTYNLDNYAQEIERNLQIAQSFARGFLLKLKIARKSDYDKHIRPLEVKQGDLVKITNEARNTRIDSFYKGPYRVISIEEPNCILKKDDETITHKVHKNRIYHFKT